MLGGILPTRVEVQPDQLTMKSGPAQHFFFPPAPILSPPLFFSFCVELDQTAREINGEPDLDFGSGFSSVGVSWQQDL